MSVARGRVSVYDLNEKVVKTVSTPAVFKCPIRPDIIRYIHTNMNKNSRQPYAVSMDSGYQTSAQSWGTGRAVARIPRVSGGGTHRSGQGAFGNMCRGGGMFAPTRTYRRWHRKVNLTEKRHALASALAATAIPSIVSARGHKVDDIPEMPLVITGDVEKLQKTSAAVELLKKFGCTAELEHVKDSRKIHAGRGKMRGRRHTMRRGPLVIYEKDEGIVKACRNIPGVELCNVERLNLLTLAPGASLGRFCIFTEGAFERLKKIYGNGNYGSAEKKNFTLLRSKMTNTDIRRIINSQEIQPIVRPKKLGTKKCLVHRNPLKNKDALKRLCPATKVAVTSAKPAKPTTAVKTIKK